MYRSVDELEIKINAYIAQNNIEQALQEITHFVSYIISHPCCDGIVLSSPILDKLCLQIGAQFLQKHFQNDNQNRSPDKGAPATYPGNPAAISNKNLVVYIATLLYASGGHTSVLEDFINNQPNKQHLILLTDLYDNAEWHKILNRFKNCPVIIKRAPAGAMTKKLSWLINELTQHNAEKTFLFNHPFDAVAIAAAQPNLVNELLFYHHADYQLTLGVHLDHAIHIDIHNQAVFHCRDKRGVKNALYWPLTVKDLGARAPESFLSSAQPLKTCSSGSLNKFNIPYAIDYRDLIPEILKATQGTHVHIGGITANYLKKIKQQLVKQNINPERFIYIPWVKSVWQTIIEHHIDLYICSFPYGGGKTAVEIMGSGTPMIVHDNYAVPLGGGHVIYPEAFHWRKASDLLAILTHIQRADLIKHSALSRQHFDKYHQEYFIKDQLAKPATLMQGLTPLPLPEFNRDELQSALDICQVIDQKIKQTKSFRNLKWVKSVKQYYKKTRKLFN